VVLGTPVANRRYTAVEGLVGFFVNTLPLRCFVDGDPSFRALVRAEKAAELAAMNHQDLPFDKLVEALRLPRDAGRNAVFQAVTTVQNARMELLSLPGCAVSPIRPEYDTAKFDLAFDHFEEEDGGVRLELQWATDLFDAVTVERLAAHYFRLLESAAQSPDAPRSALEMADAAERAFEVDVCNRTAAEYPRDAVVHRLFEEQAARTPDAVALVFAGRETTYAELNARANRLARRLRAAGVGAESPVGVAVERSAELIVALLAVLKAGGAYLPLDSAYPPERLAFMLADSRASALVVAGSVPEALASFAGPVVTVDGDRGAAGSEDDSDLPIDLGPDSLAYVIYTSGSTGTPKGVAVPHRGVVRMVWRTIYADLGAEDVLLQVAPVAFDASTGEIWAPLLNGGRINIPPPHQLSLGELAGLIRDGVTSVWLTAGLFHQMVDEEVGALVGLDKLMAGGDVVSPAHARRVLEANPGLRLLHCYGPTENTLLTTYHVVRPEDTAGVSLPLGLPVANTTAYVLDGGGRPCPVGVPGELYTGGDGVARGYAGRPALTAERFVPDPLSAQPGGRLYRTGDRVRRREDGTLEFLGRGDGQVKVRGFRIEPGEIEAALKEHPAVGDAVVIARADGSGDKRLVAYVVARNGTAPSAAELRDALRGRMPDYMVPSAFVTLDVIPLTPNGKVDRRALPEPESGADEAAYVAPRTPTEEVLAAIQAGVLGTERVGIDDDFFLLGGHSLMATQAVSRIRAALGVEVPLRVLFEAPTVRGLAARVDALLSAGEREEAAPIPPVSRDAALPLSFAQERLWFLERLLPGIGIYNMPVRMRLSGAVDAEALRGAWEAVVARHEALRVRYRAGEDGSPVQEIAPPARFDLPVVDVASEGEARAWLDEEAWRPFDRESGPLARAALLRVSADDSILAMNVHHSVGDGWSWGLIFRDVAAAYEALRRGEAADLPDLPLQYADFAAWQRGWLTGERVETQLAYWKQALQGAPAVLELPTDRPRPVSLAHRGALHPFALSPELAAKLRALAAREGATEFMVLLAAFQSLLARWAGARDVVVGSPIAGRNHHETEDIVGFFVNMLPLRAELSANPTFRDLLAHVRRTTLDAYAHQDLPFERLVEEMRVERSISYEPVFQVSFSLQNIPEMALKLDGVRAEPMEVDPRAAKYDLTLEMREVDGRLSGAFEYDTELFDAATAARLAGHFARLLETIAADPDSRPLDADLLDEAERETLARWSHGDGDAPADFVSLPDAFEARGAVDPAAPAIRFDGRTTTYGELNARANRIARRLRAMGAGPDERIAICLPRTPDAVAAILGALKTGAGYVPLDPAHPSARLAMVLADARPVAVVTSSAVSDRLSADLPKLILDAQAGEIDGECAENLGVAIHPKSLLYVLYTSGSTGTPKGVMIEHASVAALLGWLETVEPAEERKSVLASTSFTFDVSVAEVLGTLCLGGTLVMVENALELARVPAEEGVRLAPMVPTAAAELLRTGGLPSSLVALNLGGEPVPHALVEALHATGTVRAVRNLYGPTECTVYATWADLRPEDPRPPVGRQVTGSRAYVVDENLRPSPIGVPGELFLGGACVGRGYVARPAMTAERFVPDPFSAEPGARMYRTGDRIRWRADGQMEYFGRLDTQVKLRGFRIELGEVESALKRHPSVGDAAAVVREDQPGEPRLVAYLLRAAGAEPDAAELRAFCRERLPDYMVPTAYVVLDAFPQTTSGKVDRRALPAPAAAEGAEWTAPETETEIALAEIFGEVLGAERVGADDSFFELGGHSLLAARLAASVRARFDVELPLREVFEAPRLADLAARIDTLRDEALMALLGELDDISDDEARALLEAGE
jgi:amino acid adenylation domain-containing protein